MGKPTRGFVLAGAGLLTAAAPFVMAPEPAAAAVNTDTESAQLTFVDNNGTTVTCTLTNSSNHDTTEKTATASGATGGDEQCFDPTFTFYAVTISAKDENGVTHTTTASATSQFSILARLDHAVSSVHTTVHVAFGNCNPGASASCEMTVAAAPK